MAKNLKNAPEAVSAEVVANEVTNTSNRPRPEVVLLSEKVYFQPLECSKYATLPYEMDGEKRIIKCGEVNDLTKLKGFKVGPYEYDIPQCGVVLEFRATWNEIAEVDVIGSKVLNRNNTKKCGTLYLIFSPEKLDDDKRFDMMIKWPPKDKIYLKFTKDRLMDLQWFYSKPVEKYNIGMLDI